MSITRTLTRVSRASGRAARLSGDVSAARRGPRVYAGRVARRTVRRSLLRVVNAIMRGLS